MSEITKLYENAEIKPYIYCSKPQLDCNARETGNCKQDCEYYSGEKLLTPFTAEKQIAVLITLVNYNLYEEDKRLMIDSFNGEIYIGFYQDIDLKANATDKEFAECVAKLVNKLWQNLSPEEKQQVKGILE